MCGIIGVVGQSAAVVPLMGGLRRLESRGYDSAGLATVADGQLHLRKIAGRLDRLAELVAAQPPAGLLGIAHTRWATHGGPSDANAHPHTDAAERIALVHNGVIENHAALRRFLTGQNVDFRSETDTESLAQLVGFFYAQTGDLLESVRGALRQVQGTFGMALVCADAPQTLVAARRGSPLFVATGADGQFIASEPAALAGRAVQITALDDDELVRLGPDGIRSDTLAERSQPAARTPVPLDLDSGDELGGYAHHMLKEICEQPDALRNALRGRIQAGASGVVLGGLKALERELPRFRRAVLFGCGTAWHAALVGEYLLEELASLPSEVEYASELRYRNPLIQDRTLAIAVSQSGETPDTLAALREVHIRGAMTLGVVNAVGSTVARETDAGVYLHAGPEIGVAGTKSFIAMVAVLTMLALEIGRRRHLSPERVAALTDELAAVPDKIAAALALGEPIAALAADLCERGNWLCLGRGVNFPVALEGALKLKEVANLHAEGLPAAEMKHGPLALIDAGMPVVVIAPRDRTYQTVLANIDEARHRGGRVIAIASAGDNKIAALADEVLTIPTTDPLLAPLLTVVPLQLLAYHVAVARGLNVDQPRHLSKNISH